MPLYDYEDNGDDGDNDNNDNDSKLYHLQNIGTCPFYQESLNKRLYTVSQKGCMPLLFLQYLFAFGRQTF